MEVALDTHLPAAGGVGQLVKTEQSSAWKRWYWHHTDEYQSQLTPHITVAM